MLRWQTQHDEHLTLRVAIGRRAGSSIARFGCPNAGTGLDAQGKYQERRDGKETLQGWPSVTSDSTRLTAASLRRLASAARESQSVSRR